MRPSSDGRFGDTRRAGRGSKWGEGVPEAAFKDIARPVGFTSAEVS
jgi:hypothetical protein